MAFDPDTYIAQKSQPQSFDPDTYIKEKQAPQSWGDVASSAVSNILPSIGHMIGGVAESVMHPIDTATNLGKMVIGAGEAGAEKLAGMVNPELVAFNKQLNAPSESQQMAQNVGNYYAQKYGTEEGFKKALAEDPAGVMADLSTVLTAGGGLASKVPALQQAGIKLSQAAAAVDPLALTVKTVGGAVNLAGKGAQAGLGMTTGAGSEAIKQAYEAGKTGGQQAEAFQANLRGNVPMTDVLDTAKSDLAAMNAAKSAEYRNNMKAITADQSVLDFGDVKNAIKDAYDTVTYKGQIKNDAGAAALQKMSDAIGDWEQLPAKDYHTPEGFDALKQVIGGIVESIPYEEKTARMVGGDIYNSIKGTIAKQAPVYNKTMSDYSSAAEQIREIERTLSLGDKAAADTAMRKLQSLMRNNASTNYGNRLKLAQELEQQGGQQIMPALAGQALSSMEPRGLQRLGAAGVGAAGVMTANPMAIPLMAASSPRLMGETAYYTGKGAKAAGAAKNRLAAIMNPRIAANLAYQAQQPKR